MENTKDISILRKLARNKNISLSSLAKKMNISREALYQRIRGEVCLNVNDLKVLKEVFDLTPVEIYEYFIK